MPTRVVYFVARPFTVETMLSRTTRPAPTGTRMARSAICWTCRTELAGCVEVALALAFEVPVALEALAVFGALAAGRLLGALLAVVVSLVLVDISETLRCLKDNSKFAADQL